jgi:hypothetical protein
METTARYFLAVKRSRRKVRDRLFADLPDRDGGRLDSLAPFAHHPLQASVTGRAPSVVTINGKNQADYGRFE